jgi:class 3 adenylate cyclase
MRAPSFRLKLLLAMMFVVAGVTGATLFVTERRVQASYARLSGDQFASQVQFFTSMQESRLGFVKDRCRELVQSVRLREALRVAVLEGEVDLLYQTADDELRDLRQDSAARRGLTFFRFFDPNGKVLAPVGDAASGGASAYRAAPLTGTVVAGSEQSLGFLSWQPQTGLAVLQEIIVTPVIDPFTGETLGALMLAFPVPELLEQTGAAISDRMPPDQTRRADGATDPMTMLGLWFDDRLYVRAGVIGEADAASLTSRIRDEMTRSSTPQDDFVVTLGGVPHRVFYRSPEAGSRLPMAYQICLYSLADAYRDRRDLRVRILGFAALGLGVALALSLALSHGLSVPIRELVAGTLEIQRGNLEVKVPVRNHDEIGQLAESFNDMAVGLALKEKYRAVLNVVSDEQIADALLGGDLVLGGELRDVAVLFCDIRGFTALTQTMPPGEVIGVLNEHMTALTRVVKEHQGVVDKFVGDLIMAIFGAPVRRGDDALAAARCAMGMIEERARLNRTSRHDIRIGIGIATGQAVAGCMGSVDRLNYTVLGERVNLASRLCSKASPMQVVIDQTTRERLAGLADAIPLPPLELKGLDGPIQAYQLISVEGRVPTT